MTDLVQTVYRAFNPAPLTPEQSALYVELDAARGDEVGVVHRLAQTIALADRLTCQVLAGHKGCGKTTELLRLKRTLESGSLRQFVVFCKADDDIDRNDVDFPEVLIAIIRQLAFQVKNTAGISLKAGYFKDRWERLKRLMFSEVQFESMELDVGMTTIAAAIKASPDARVELRKHLEPDTSNWLAAANEVIGQAVTTLRTKGYAGLVILVDDLDKMVVRPVHQTNLMTDEHLFVNRSAQLTAFGCHVVYTMPLSLAYSHLEQSIKASYGGHVPVVPMTKLATAPPRVKPHEPGIAKFREIIAKRLAAAGVQPTQVFLGDTVRDELIRLTGGQPTALMTLVREAIVAQGLPIRSESLRRVWIAGQREYARQLRMEHWPIIEAIRRTGKYIRRTETEEAFRELVESRAILQYVNDEEWYGLNPMVADLKPPPGVSRATKPAKAPPRLTRRRKK